MACCILIATIVAVVRSKLQRRGSSSVLTVVAVAWSITAVGYLGLATTASALESGLDAVRPGRDALLAALGLSAVMGATVAHSKQLTTRARWNAALAIGPMWLALSTFDMHALGNPDLPAGVLADLVIHTGGFALAPVAALGLERTRSIGRHPIEAPT